MSVSLYFIFVYTFICKFLTRKGLTELIMKSRPQKGEGHSNSWQILTRCLGMLGVGEAPPGAGWCRWMVKRPLVQGGAGGW